MDFEKEICEENKLNLILTPNFIHFYGPPICDPNRSLCLRPTISSMEKFWGYEATKLYENWYRSFLALSLVSPYVIYTCENGASKQTL